LNNPEYEVVLVPHVFGKGVKGPYSVDDDVQVIDILKEKYVSLKTIPIIEYSSSELKSIISQLDVLVGARMHATIAAFSAGVATIPFSYSRKFEGLYNSLGYDYVVSGTKLTTDEALDYTMELVNKRELLKAKSKACMETVVKPLLDDFYYRIEKELLSK
jgi:polysaccharide pyruvyl transferase WcaK-like protein